MVGPYPEERAMDDRPQRPISRLRRDHRRRPLWWWLLALAGVVAVMILLPKILERLG